MKWYRDLFVAYIAMIAVLFFGFILWGVFFYK